MTDENTKTETTEPTLQDRAELAIRERLTVLEEWGQRANSAIRALGVAVMCLCAVMALMLLASRRAAA
jgi:hypothetical protein